jgi:hypothetical protein
MANFNHNHAKFKSQKLHGCEVWHASICGFGTAAGFLALIHLFEKKYIYLNMTNFKINKNVHITFYTYVFIALKERKALSALKL